MFQIMFISPTDASREFLYSKIQDLIHSMVTYLLTIHFISNFYPAVSLICLIIY